MEQRFGVKLNRRTLKNYLDLLLEAGYPLNADAYDYPKPDGSFAVRQTGWCMEPQFEVSELRLLYDLLHSIPALPAVQRDSLFRKLCENLPAGMAADALDDEPPVVHLLRPPVPQLMFTVDLLCEAIRKRCMVSFSYCRFELDENGKPQLVPRTDENGVPRCYQVSPYRIMVMNSRYYLVCRKHPFETLSHYRVDRITDIRLLDVPCEPMPDAPVLPSQTLEQLYMYSGEQVTCRFLADACVLGDIVDWFGSEVHFAPAGENGQLCVTVRVHPQAMEHWALQYARHVTVLEPESLRASIAEAVRMLTEKYPSSP